MIERVKPEFYRHKNRRGFSTFVLEVKICKEWTPLINDENKTIRLFYSTEEINHFIGQVSNEEIVLLNNGHYIYNPLKREESHYMFNCDDEYSYYKPYK